MLKSKIKQRIWALTLAVIVLFSSADFVSAENNQVNQQPQTLQGKVTDVNGIALPGVNVVVKGTIMGAISNADGTFSISVPNQNATLVFSFIGYIAKEVTLTSLQFLNVTLAEETTALDEVVVIGYGTQRKRDLTGSVAAANIDRKSVV